MKVGEVIFPFHLVRCSRMERRIVVIFPQPYQEALWTPPTTLLLLVLLFEDSGVRRAHQPARSKGLCVFPILKHLAWLLQGVKKTRRFGVGVSVVKANPTFATSVVKVSLILIPNTMIPQQHTITDTILNTSLHHLTFFLSSSPPPPPSPTRFHYHHNTTIPQHFITSSLTASPTPILPATTLRPLLHQNA